MAKKSNQINWNKNKAGSALYKNEHYKMFYTKVMRGEKRLKGEVKMMSPEAFIKTPFFRSKVNEKHVANLVIWMKQGHFVSLPVLDYIHGKSDGKHRVLAAKELGVKEVPVLVCGKPKKD